MMREKVSDPWNLFVHKNNDQNKIALKQNIIETRKRDFIINKNKNTSYMSTFSVHNKHDLFN